ncbi:MAG: DDE-type integrase/transposase/recombinase [Firmicutes bacterium]|nr:DDE-type integrase/transposase/recombinase [Bacillota bacterium]
MDLFSRKIIAWRLSKTLEAKWVVECIQEAKKSRRITQPLVCHSDRGSQYVSAIYLEALDRIMPSYSRKASPWQNACIESFHALIKREWLYSFKIKDFDHAYKLVF